MKNATQLKALVKNIAKDKGISAQIIMQNYMLERLLERISISKYKSNFIIKGGFLIAAIVGLDTRSTTYVALCDFLTFTIILIFKDVISMITSWGHPLSTLYLKILINS